MEEKKAKKTVDWEAIAPDWRAGIKSKAQLSKEYDVSRAAMDKHFAALGIERDVTEAIQARAESLVTHDAVTPQVTGETKATERALVEANAEMLANVIRGHRKDLGALRGVVVALLSEVNSIVTEAEIFEQIGDLCLQAEDGADKVNDLYRKVISLPSKTDSVKKLAETLKVLIELERKVFKLETAEDPNEASARGAAQGAVQGMAVAGRSFLADLMAGDEEDNAPAA